MHQYVIKVYPTHIEGQPLKNLIHEALKSQRRISKVKWHHLELPQPIACCKRCLSTVSVFHLNLSIAALAIKRRKPGGTGHCVMCRRS